MHLGDKEQQAVRVQLCLAASWNGILCGHLALVPRLLSCCSCSCSCSRSRSTGGLGFALPFARSSPRHVRLVQITPRYLSFLSFPHCALAPFNHLYSSLVYSTFTPTHRILHAHINIGDLLIRAHPLDIQLASQPSPPLSASLVPSFARYILVACIQPTTLVFSCT